MMTTRLNPYIRFAGDARRAMEFYQTVFGGTLDMNTFGEFGAAEGSQVDQIMHAHLETDNGFTLMASDTPQGMGYQPGDTITISLSGDEADALRGYWDKLSDGATVQVPLEKQVWGDEFGQLVDKFGIAWMVNIQPKD
jgi:PhnB protein